MIPLCHSLGLPRGDNHKLRKKKQYIYRCLQLNGDILGIEKNNFGIIYVSLSSKAIKSNNQNLCISPLNDTMRTIKDKYTSCKVNELWNIFKVDLIKSIETNRPHKMITCKHTTQDDNIQTYHTR